jgi:hypothetical protein
MESVEKKMTPATCSCGEVFWSATWRRGKMTKCPICGGAVGILKSDGEAVVSSPPDTGRVSGAAPRPTASRSSGDRPPASSRDVDAAQRTTTWAPGERPPLASRKITPQAVTLAAGSLVLLTACIVVGTQFFLGRPPKVEDRPPVPPPVDKAGADGGHDVGNTEGVPPPPPRPGSSAPLTLLVPAYFYPSGPGLEDWNQLFAAARRIPIVVIVNPESGPGIAPNPDYAAIVRQGREAGATMIGYVNTGYAKRARDEIEDDIDKWVRFYPEIGGIFFDAQSSEAKHVDHYVKLCQYARRKVTLPLVVTNPGTLCAEEYFSTLASDVAILFENRGGFQGFNLPPWARNYPPQRFAATPYSIESAEKMKGVIQQALQKRVGYLYVTDDSDTNPWSGLPSYWAEEVQAVTLVNEHKPL